MRKKKSDFFERRSPAAVHPQMTRRSSGRTHRLPHISDAEWRVMKVLWRQAPLTANQVVATLAPVSDWKPKTVHTLLRRLVDKGALGFAKRGREYLFRPRVDARACVRAVSRSFLHRVFDGELAPFLACFLEQEKLSAAEIQELRDLLEQRGR